MKPKSDYPVDTLGIPILVDVVEQGDPAAAWEKPSAAAETDRPGRIEEQSGSASVFRSRHDPEDAWLDSVIDELAARISSNLIQSLEPMIQKKIGRTLKKQAAEIAETLARTPPEPGSDGSGSDT